MDLPRVRLGELLVKSGLLTQEQLDEALAVQRRDGRRLGTLLVELGLVTETQVTQILSQQLSVPWVALHHIEFSPQLLELVPAEVVEHYCLVPIYVRRVRGLGDALYVAMDDPTNEMALKEVAAHAGLRIRPMIAPPSDIRAVIRAYYRSGAAPEPDEGSVAGSDRQAADPEPEPSREPQESGVGLKAPEPMEAPPPPQALRAADGTLGREAPSRAHAPESTKPASQNRARKATRVISLTLLDGTKINVPARPGAPAPEPAPPPQEEGEATAREIVAALRAAAHGADASEVLGDGARWERMFAALLSLLLKKRLITDAEFIEEFKKG